MKEYTKLTLRDRCLIKIGIDNRETPAKIAKKMGRDRSTISREISKNGGIMWYSPEQAHANSLKSNKKGYSKINENQQLKDYIVSKVKLSWSPEVIAGRWKLESHGIEVSHESIYSWIYSDPMKQEKLFSYLPRRKKKRGIFIRKSINSDKNKQSINVRPEAVNSRSRVGDWEADLVFQKGNQSANFLTAIERKTRFAFVIKNASKKSRDINLAIGNLKQNHSIKTLTLDNGSEFSEYSEYGVDTYFCDPGSPWQKGAIEHLNGMVRRRINRKIPIDQVDQDLIDKVVDDLNNMPRKILGYLTPQEAISESRMKLAQPAIEASLL